MGLTQGALGSTYLVIEFKNLNNAPCSLYGYPGVVLDNGHPVSPVGLSAAENPATPRELVILQPHGRANAHPDLHEEHPDHDGQRRPPRARRQRLTCPAGRAGASRSARLGPRRVASMAVLGGDR